MFEIRLLLITTGIVAAGWSIQHWRRAVRVALVLLIFEGALRKWVFPGAQDLVYFAKDVFFLGSYLGFLHARPHLRFRPPTVPALNAALVAAVLWGVWEVLNPNLPNLLVGILGFKAYFFYVPLLFVVPAAFDSDADLIRFLRRYALITIPVVLLAIAQFFSPPGSLLNTYAWNGNEVYIATFGSSEFVRVTGTFSFITGFTSYLQATAILDLALLGLVSWRWRGNTALFLALGTVFMGIMMSGSRGPVLILSLLFPFYWWLAITREGGSGATSGRLVLGIGLLAALLLYTGEDAVNAFYGRAVAGQSDVSSRLMSPLQAPLDLFPRAGLLGMGIGATHQTAMAVTRGIPPYSWLKGMVTELETGRIVVEIGGIGFALIYFIRLYLVFFALRQVFRLRTRFHRMLAIAAFLFAVAQLPGGAIFDVTSGVFYWFFPSLLLTALRFDQIPAPEPQPPSSPALASRPWLRNAPQSS